MGLDAVVFRNAETLTKEFGRDLFDIDEGTGEAVQRDTETKIPREKFFAIERRLGNLSEIARLRETVNELLGTGDSLLQSRVLYSGSHSGDSISLSQLPRLRDEIDRLKTCGHGELTQFIDAMEALLNAAQAEGNPIVFV